jgi:ferredoxin-type protein NapH
MVLYLLGPLAGVWLIKGNLSSSMLLETIPLTDPLLLPQMLAAGATIGVTTVVTGAIIVLLAYLLVGGRVFCSWVCPVNVITDAADWLRRRLNIRTGSHLPRNTRYWALAAIVLLSASTGMLAWEFINPVSWVQRGIIFGLGAGWAMILALFLLDLLVSKRAWCGHLCPMGAFYGLIGRFSAIRVSASARDRCDDCNECYVVCPEPQVIRPALKGKGTEASPLIVSGECTNCGRCIDICAENVFHFGFRFGHANLQNKANIVDNHS